MDGWALADLPADGERMAQRRAQLQAAALFVGQAVETLPELFGGTPAG
jgi:hypothetical protein